MSAVRAKGTRLEARVLNLLEGANLHPDRLHDHMLPGKPDYVFSDVRTVLFLDSCFWHGCELHLRLPATNVAYWKNKIERNRERDLYQMRLLRASGWSVVRIWEHELTREDEVVARIRRALARRRSQQTRKGSNSRR